MEEIHVIFFVGLVGADADMEEVRADDPPPCRVDPALISVRGRRGVCFLSRGATERSGHSGGKLTTYRRGKPGDVAAPVDGRLRQYHY